MLYQPNERILPWILTKDHLVLHTSCCFLQLYNEPLYNGTRGWNKRTVIISAEVMTLTPLTLDGFLQDSFLFLLPYQESDPVGESGGSTCHSHPHPPTPPPKIIIIGIHYNTRRLQVINQHKYLETEFCIIHDVPIHCLSPLYDPN